MGLDENPSYTTKPKTREELMGAETVMNNPGIIRAATHSPEHGSTGSKVVGKFLQEILKTKDIVKETAQLFRLL